MHGAERKRAAKSLAKLLKGINFLRACIHASDPDGSLTAVQVNSLAPNYLPNHPNNSQKSQLLLNCHSRRKIVTLILSTATVLQQRESETAQSTRYSPASACRYFAKHFHHLELCPTHKRKKHISAPQNSRPCLFVFFCCKAQTIFKTTWVRMGSVMQNQPVKREGKQIRVFPC